MRFVIEKMPLTQARGESVWDHEPEPEYCCEAEGASARSVLTRFVHERRDDEVGIGATFQNGQAVIVARNGATLYALRAVPLRHGARI